jgi:hypothetical protein
MFARLRVFLRSSIRSSLAASLASLLAGAAPLAAQEPDVDVGAGQAAQIAEIERQIARDRTTLRELIGATGVPRADIALDPRLREIAERLPRLQRELEALRREPTP